MYHMLMVEHLDSRRKYENYFYSMFGMLIELVGKETPSMLPSGCPWTGWWRPRDLLYLYPPLRPI